VAILTIHDFKWKETFIYVALPHVKELFYPNWIRT